MKIDLNNKKFRSISISEKEEINKNTIFHYHQHCELYWDDYSGGGLIKDF